MVPGPIREHDSCGIAPGVPGAASIRVQHVMSRLTGGRDAATTRGARSCWLCSLPLVMSMAFIEEAASSEELLRHPGLLPDASRGPSLQTRLRADLQRRLPAVEEEDVVYTPLLSAQRAFGDGRLAPGAWPGHPEAPKRPRTGGEAQNGVDSRSGILQTPKELVESPFPAPKPNLEGDVLLLDPKNSYPFSVVDTSTDRLLGILPSNGGHHDCVIIPTRVEQMKHTRPARFDRARLTGRSLTAWDGSRLPCDLERPGL